MTNTFEKLVENGIVVIDSENPTNCSINLGPTFNKDCWNAEVEGVTWGIRIQPKQYPEDGWMPPVYTQVFKTLGDAWDWKTKVITKQCGSEFLNDYEWITDPFIRGQGCAATV